METNKAVVLGIYNHAYGYEIHKHGCNDISKKWFDGVHGLTVGDEGVESAFLSMMRDRNSEFADDNGENDIVNMTDKELNDKYGSKYRIMPCCEAITTTKKGA